MVRPMSNIFQKIIYRFAGKLVNPIDRLANAKYYDFPFGRKARASVDEYMDIWIEAKAKEFPEIDLIEEQLGYSIEKEWLDALALKTQVVKKDSDICYQHGRLLYATLSSYIDKIPTPKALTILETGTARGFSSLCMAKALHDTKQPGKILTFDILPNEEKMYWNCESDSVGPHTRLELLEEYQELLEEYLIFIQGDSALQLAKISVPRVHFAFLDGAHTFAQIIAEFSAIRHKQKEGDFIFFDDYSPSIFPELVQGIDRICEEFQYGKKIVRLTDQRGYAIATKL